MGFETNTIISDQVTASNFCGTQPLTSSTSLLCDSTESILPSTQGRTTAATVASLVLPGVDIVVYEAVNNHP